MIRAALALSLLALLAAPTAQAHDGGFRPADVPQVKVRFERYLEATTEKRMFVRDAYVACAGTEAFQLRGRKAFHHVRCSAKYGAQLDHRTICRVYHASRAGAISSTACPKR
jgi:hypothetical protein